MGTKKQVEHIPDWGLSSGTVCCITKGCMFKTHKQLSKRQKECIPPSSEEISDGLNLFVILPDNGALIDSSSLFSRICTDPGALGFLWLASLILPVHVPPQERHRPSSASATMALQRAAGDLRAHAVWS